MVFISNWGFAGISNGKFSFPGMYFVTHSIGNVYVLDFVNHRIQKFDTYGVSFYTQFKVREMEGSKNPTGISIDSIGNVYVSDAANTRVQKFDSAGKLITKWALQMMGDNQLQNPTGIAIDLSDNVHAQCWQ